MTYLCATVLLFILKMCLLVLYNNITKVEILISNQCGGSYHLLQIKPFSIDITLIFLQGMGMIVATFLLLMEEEDAFWMMVATVEDLLPASYYSPSLIGVQADQVLFKA